MGVTFTRRNVDVLVPVHSDLRRLSAWWSCEVETVLPPDLVEWSRPLVEAGEAVCLPWVDDWGLAGRVGTPLITHAHRHYACTSTVDAKSIIAKQALSCGTPVISAPLLREAAGDRALSTENPTSVEDAVGMPSRAPLARSLRHWTVEHEQVWVWQIRWPVVAERTTAFFERR